MSFSLKTFENSQKINNINCEKWIWRLNIHKRLIVSIVKNDEIHALETCCRINRLIEEPCDCEFRSQAMP